MILTSKAKVTNLTEGRQVEAEIDGHKFLFDEDEDAGGTGKGPGPMSTMLACLGGCQTMTVQGLARKMRIELKRFSIELEGDMDSEALAHKEGAPKGYIEVRYYIHIETDAPKERVERMIALMEEFCPVENTFRNPVKLVRGGLTIE